MASDTAENLAFVDMLETLAVVTEFNDTATAAKAAFGAQLVTAGINPVTYLVA